MLEITLTMKGERPLVVRSDRSVNPLDPLTREIAKLSNKRKKTEEDHALMSRMDFEVGIYWEQELGPYIPTGNVHKALVEGARLSKLGKEIERGCIPLEIRSPILYEGPRGLDDLYANPDHVYTVSVGIGTRRVMRTRARFPRWALQVPFVLDTERIDLDMFEQIADVTGRAIGIGERRPMFGAFTAHIESTKGALNGDRNAVSAA